MRYGHFDDAAKEYVIETPATPLPWINYLGNKDFFSLISNTGGGYSFYKDAKLRRVTRYRYNNVPADNGSRCYYLSLMDSDSADAKPVETWSPTFLPCKTPLDSYKCRQGIGYTVFEASKRGIESKLTAFVPLHTNAEINRLDVTNTTDEPAVIDVTGSVEWCLWNAVDDSSNFQRNLSTGEVEIERETDATLLYHKTEFKERRNHYAFYGVNAPVVGFDTSRDEFLGQFNGWDTPQVIAEGKAHDSVAHGWFPIAANRVRLELQPGETASLVFMLGYIEVAKDQKWEDPNDPAKVGIINKKPAHELFRRFATVEQVEAALKAAQLLLVRTADHLQRRFRRRKARPYGQHLAPVPVHGHVQYVPFRLLLRVGHGTRHGLPRFQPGPAWLRASHSGTRTRAHHRHRLHPNGGRFRMAPVPAAHQEGQCGHRWRLQ